MGRGRAKAKQQKVARELKYNSSHMTDLDALQRELSSHSPAEDADSGDELEDDDGGWTSASAGR
jgi:hypothetical protein